MPEWPKIKALRADKGAVFLESGAASPSPTARQSGKHCKLPEQGLVAEPWPLKDVPVFWSPGKDSIMTKD